MFLYGRREWWRFLLHLLNLPVLPGDQGWTEQAQPRLPLLMAGTHCQGVRENTTLFLFHWYNSPPNQVLERKQKKMLKMKACFKPVLAQATNGFSRGRRLSVSYLWVGLVAFPFSGASAVTPGSSTVWWFQPLHDTWMRVTHLGSDSLLPPPLVLMMTRIKNHLC